MATRCCSSPGPFTTVAAASKNPGYDPVRQFVPTASIATTPLVFVVNPSVPADSMREFIALAKREPGKLNYGSAGTASINHLALELLNARAGIDIVHVPYKGIAPATLDLMSGQIQAMTGTVSATLPYIAEKKVKALAVTGARRAPLLPNVPSWQEAGIANADVINYWGIVAPAGTPTRNHRQAQCRRERRAGPAGGQGAPGTGRRRNRRRPARAARRDHRGRLAGWKKLIAEVKLQLD